MGTQQTRPGRRSAPRISSSSVELWFRSEVDAVCLVASVEHAVKKPVFSCRMCGQCVLHDTGMTCPMTCPKTLRNGPCGGVREDGTCEVITEMRCVWLKAEERSRTLPLLPA